jgi:predicted metalloprotease
MTFNDDARINSSKVKRRGATGGVVAGGGIGVAIIVFLIAQFTGFDLSGVVPSDQPAGPDQAVAECDNISGEEANKTVDCRMAGAALVIDSYWAEELPALGGTYVTPEFILFEGSVATGCGNATSATGPFYCPPDQTIYVDTDFYAELTERFGANGGPLAEMYVLAHEWGHHIQNISGIMDGLDNQTTGPTSDGVRLELQADCFAGAWVGAAATREDESGTTYLEPFTDQDIADALSAASAVGDDRIQESTSGQVNPETWTHGSSEQRQAWFQVGRANGPDACNTFEVSGNDL